jgi:YD repeat-containing protein
MRWNAACRIREQNRSEAAHRGVTAVAALLACTLGAGPSTGRADDSVTRKDALEATTKYTYNARGGVLTVTDPSERVAENVYDDRGNLLSSRDAAARPRRTDTRRTVSPRRSRNPAERSRR